MKKTLFIKNAAILTASSLVLRFAGIIFKVWLAAKIGAEGIGLYQLVFSIYMFAATFATSGICTAVTRLVSEELVVGEKRTIKQIISRCIQLSTIIATISLIVLFFSAGLISKKFLQQPDAEISLKILGFSLPFMGICSCLKGYFIARRKAAPSSTSQLLEQAVRIAVIIPFLTNCDSFDLKYACAAVIFGDTIAEILSCVYIYIRYKLDFKKLSVCNECTHKPRKLLPLISRIALPITSGRYLNTLLRTIENVLVPICLSNSIIKSDGISLFGMIKGMALPLLFFPSTLLNALSTLLLPEICDAQARRRNAVVKAIISKIIKITGIVSVLFACLFFVVGDQIGQLIYKSYNVGLLLRLLSPIIPFMYLDAISDGILKGLDQQKFTFITSVADSTLRIAFILITLKQYGVYAFIGIMYFSNFFTGFLNTKRLLKVSNCKACIAQNLIIPLCCAFVICVIAKLLLQLINLSTLVYVVCMCIVSSALYVVLLFALKIIDYDDISFIKRK